MSWLYLFHLFVFDEIILKFLQYFCNCCYDIHIPAVCIYKRYASIASWCISKINPGQACWKKYVTLCSCWFLVRFFFSYMWISFCIVHVQCITWLMHFSIWCIAWMLLVNFSANALLLFFLLLQCCKLISHFCIFQYLLQFLFTFHHSIFCFKDVALFLLSMLRWFWINASLSLMSV